MSCSRVVYIVILVPEDLVEPIIFILEQTRLMCEQSPRRVVEAVGLYGQSSNGVQQDVGWARMRKTLVSS